MPVQGQGFSLADDYLFSINNQKEFNQLKGEPLSDIYSGIKCVKLCYHIADNQLYFINSTRFRYHMDFCERIFADTYDIAEYNKTNYTNNPNRKYCLGTLNYYTSQHVYTLEFVSEDDIPLASLQQMYLQLKKNVKLDAPIYLLVNNSFLMNLEKRIKNIPLIYPENIFKNQTYQALVVGNTYGYARRINNLSKEFNNILANDIIFFDGTPLSLPDCKAVVTSTMQTPLSHINVLCNNRKTPACAYTLFDSILTAKKLWNKPILIKIQKNKIDILPATELDIVKKKNINRKKIVLKSDTVTKALQVFDGKSAMSIKNIGSKSYGVSQLYKIHRLHPQLFAVPAGAFAIPFYYYAQHMKSKTIQQELKKLLDIPLQYKDSVNRQLKKVRKAIQSQKIDVALLDVVGKQLSKNNANTSYRFRSSSNAEDIDGFNGAGLYESHTGILKDTTKTIEKAIKKVWASVWNEEAYQERSLFGIDNQTVLMAVLVHQGFPAEEANGVAITRNLFRKGFHGYTINVQVGEVSVVAPEDSITCDQFVCFDSEEFTQETGKVFAQYITRSNINGGKNVLTQLQIEQLYKALSTIKEYYYFRNPNASIVYSYEEFALDIEFKFNEGKLFIKQVRSYK